MLNFKTVNILFLLATAILIAAGFIISFSFSLPAFVLLILIYISSLVYGSAAIGSGFFIKAICSIETDEKKIAITFDDGPVKEITPLLLDFLNEQKIKATFFCIGSRIKGNENILKRIDSESHLLGNHSFSHSSWFDLYSSKRMIEELKKTEDAIQKNIQKKVKLFRPPYGVTNPNLKKAFEEMDYTVIGWNVRSFDTMGKPNGKILKRISRKIKPGSIILFHDSNQNIIPLLKDFITYTTQNNYQIIRLDELLNIKAYE